MKINLNDLPPHIKALNPELCAVGGLAPQERKRVEVQTLESRPQKQAEGKSRIVISLARYSSRELDDDNLVISFKPLRDAIAEVIGLDDGDKRIKWEYGQFLTTGPKGCCVRISL